MAAPKHPIIYLLCCCISLNKKCICSLSFYAPHALSPHKIQMNYEEHSFSKSPRDSSFLNLLNVAQVKKTQANNKF
jgi:hypothetical protein